MGFSGFWQVLCKNGHYDNLDCFTVDCFTWKCSICGEGAYWYNLVDSTNGSYDSSGNRIDGFIFLEINENKSEYCICEKCGNSHAIKEEIIYYFPKNRGNYIKPKKRKDKKCLKK